MKEIRPIEGEVEVLEKRVVKRLTLKNYIYSILDAFNVEHGGVFTMKRLLQNPGAMTREYISTGRFSYTPPFRLLLISTALALLLLTYSSAFENYQTQIAEDPNQEKVLEIMKELSQFYNVILWLFIPIVAFFTWLFNRKSGFNFTENLVLQTYLFTISNLFTMLFILDQVLPYQIIYTITMVGSFCYSLYAFKEFYQKRWLPSFFEYLGIYLLSIVIYTIVISILFAVLVFIKLGLPG